MMRQFLSRFICFTNETNETNENKFSNINESNISNLNLKEVKPFVPPISSGFVVKVYDGDTITIISRLPYSQSALYKFSVRLNGIDCPEIKGKTEYERECAKIAQSELEQLILNKQITLKNVKTEKYGRILADVYLGDLNLNQYMLDHELAVMYDGGTKTKPTNTNRFLEVTFDE